MHRIFIGLPYAACLRVSKKWLNATFLTLCENLKVFIRSDVHAVRAGICLRGSRPLTTPGVFRQAAVFYVFSALCAGRNGFIISFATPMLNGMRA